MLVRITNRCTMQCSHCLVDASPYGEHMTERVFHDTVGFVLRLGLPIMLISGGEPTENPNCVEFVRYARSYGIHLTLLSNGEFLHKNPSLRDEILKHVESVQISNDPRYYPRRVEPYNHPKVGFVSKIERVSPHGRAVKNGLKAVRRAPECFNIRSLVCHTGSFFDARVRLASMRRLCTPSVNVDGTLSAGETPSCAIIGRVTDSEFHLEEQLTQLRCNKCGLVKNLNPREREAIGEDTTVLLAEV